MTLKPEGAPFEPEVLLFTDGACSGNPGPGGWAFILRHVKSNTELEKSGFEEDTTNNRMELQAVIEGLETLKRSCRVELFTDSEYVRNGLMTWMKNWKKNNWIKSSDKKPVKNVDLWKRLDELLSRHELKFTRVAGHSGHPENDRCDQLAVEAYQKRR
jgi:ribonuclease HI